MEFLIADDERTEREGMIMLLRQILPEASICEAKNGEDALEHLRKKKYDVLITDIKMPFMDGLTLAHEVRNQNMDIQIVILSAYGDFKKAQAAISEQVFQYLLKPVDVHQFQKTILRLVELKEEQKKMEAQKWKMEDSYRKHQMQSARLQAVLSQEPYHQLREDILQLIDLNEDENRETAVRRNLNPAIARTLELIHSNYNKDLPLDEIARNVHLTPTYLCSLFKRQMSISLVQYINNYRIDQAAQQLRETSQKVGEIAANVGIPNVSYFNSMFKQRYLMTPAQYRKANMDIGETI